MAGHATEAAIELPPLRHEVDQLVTVGAVATGLRYLNLFEVCPIQLEVADGDGPPIAANHYRTAGLLAVVQGVAGKTHGNGIVLHLYTVDGYRQQQDRKSTRLNSSHVAISYAVFCFKQKT